MVREALYHKTVGILVDAYFNDTLQHNNCHACAVGNIIAANNCIGFKTETDNKIWKGNSPTWHHVFMTDTGKQNKRPMLYKGEPKDQIDSSGYTWQELAQIEYAFETVSKGNSVDEYMFNGLMAVIEVLDKIHENTDIQIQQESKKRFLKTA
jgi:hypothetical protein